MAYFVEILWMKILQWPLVLNASPLMRLNQNISMTKEFCACHSSQLIPAPSMFQAIIPFWFAVAALLNVYKIRGWIFGFKNVFIKIIVMLRIIDVLLNCRLIYLFQTYWNRGLNHTKLSIGHINNSMKQLKCCIVRGERERENE